MAQDEWTQTLEAETGWKDSGIYLDKGNKNKPG